ncbi:MAG: hypothetical protein V4478_01670 [Patescibacteria group bacterium]
MKTSEYFSLKALINNFFITKIIVFTVIISIICAIAMVTVMYQIVFYQTASFMEWRYCVFIDIACFVLLIFPSMSLHYLLDAKGEALKALDSARGNNASYEKASDAICSALSASPVETEEIAVS